MKNALGLAVVAALSLSAAPAYAGDDEAGPLMLEALKGHDLYVTLKTNLGSITIRLFPKDAPRTVANFVGLAAGEKSFDDPGTGAQVKRPFYDGVVFHRVIPEFMIQGGDPTGTGRGGPGYAFEDEFQSGRGFDETGLLAMANRGPNTNGSQFFITTSTPAHLNGKHTIFGKVIEGYDVVEKISRVPTGPGNKPLSKVVIEKVTIDAPALKKPAKPALQDAPVKVKPAPKKEAK